MTLLLVDRRPLMVFDTLAEALAYVRQLSSTMRSQLTLTAYTGPALSR